MAKKILKHGDPDKINGLKYFRCDYCGCMFEAEKCDYWGGDQRDPGYYSSCPDCGAGCSEMTDGMCDTSPDGSIRPSVSDFCSYGEKRDD